MLTRIIMQRQFHQLLYISTLVAGVALALLAPLLLVPQNIQNKGVYIAIFNPFRAEEMSDFQSLQAARARVLTRGYPGVYLVTDTSPHTLPTRLRQHGAWLVLPPSLGLGCYFSDINEIK